MYSSTKSCSVKTQIGHALTPGGTIRSFGSHRIRHGTAMLLVNDGMPLEEVSRYLGHASTQVTRRYAQTTPGAFGERVAEALARAGVSAG